MPQLTDERLRSWLDGQQLARERMCLAVLSLDKRFKQVTPRNPRGGRDGGRDLEAIYEDGQKAWIAIGFQNSVSDSDADKKQAEQKFKSDLKRAQDENSSLGVFVFFTNVSLTAGKKDTLCKHAKGKGLGIIDIYDRERIRISLDSADGLAVRFQYLGITLSDAEQAAFFGRWGADIESLITNSITAVETRLSRIEFFLERNQPLTRFSYHIMLKKDLTRAQLGHFRADFTMFFMPPREDLLKVHLGICNDRGGLEGDKPRRKDCMSSIGWTTGRDNENPEDIIHRSHGLLEEPIRQLSVRSGDSFFRIPLMNAKLDDLEGNMIAFFVNKKLSKLIDKIAIVANEYLVWSVTQDDLIITDHNYTEKWPYEFTDTELNDPWVRIMSKNGPKGFDFSTTTPYRLYKARAVEPPTITENK